MRRRQNMAPSFTYNHVLKELDGIDYSKRSEIKKPKYLYSDPPKNGSRWKAGDPLPLPQKGRNYALYFNLNAMRMGAYHKTSEKGKAFIQVEKQMKPTLSKKSGKSVVPFPSM